MFARGFYKIAAPRWFKELTKNKSGFRKSLNKTFAKAESRWGVTVEKQLLAKAPSRKDIGESLFGIKPRRFHKDMPLWEKSINITRDLPMSHPARRAAYFKANNKWYRQIISMPKDMVDNNAINAIKNSSETSKKYMTGELPARYNMSFPFSSINSKDLVKVKHVTRTENIKKILGGGHLRSPSAGYHNIQKQGLFTFPAKSKDLHLFAGTPKQRALGKKQGHSIDLSVIHSKVPENDIIYLPPAINPARQKDAELFVNINSFIKNKTGARKLK